MVALLLDHGADVNAGLPLYGAAGIDGDARTTRPLLAHGANPGDGESLARLLEAGATVTPHVAEPAVGELPLRLQEQLDNKTPRSRP